MEPPTADLGHILDSSKLLARRLFTIGENRLQLLIVEVQEERDRRLQAIILALGVAIFGLLALLTLNVAVVVALWNHSPVTVLLVLAGLYTVSALGLYLRLNRLLSEWKMFSATLDQLQKDRACLEKHLA